METAVPGARVIRELTQDIQLRAADLVLAKYSACVLCCNSVSMANKKANECQSSLVDLTLDHLGSNQRVHIETFFCMCSKLKIRDLTKNKSRLHVQHFITLTKFNIKLLLLLSMQGV